MKIAEIFQIGEKKENIEFVFEAENPSLFPAVFSQLSCTEAAANASKRYVLKLV